MTNSKKIFVRESSGLIRELNAKDAFARVFGVIVPISVYYTLLYSPTLPAASWNIGVILAAILAIPVLFVYLKLAEHIPRSGGEYIYITRILHPILGQVQGVANIFSFAVLSAILAQIEISAGIAPAFQILGLAFHNSALLNIGTDMLTNPTDYLISTFIVLIILWIVSILPPRYIYNYLFIGSVMLVLGGILIIALFAQGPSVFQSAFNRFSSLYKGPTYASLYHSGLSYYSPIVNPLQTLIWAILLLIWNFVWFFSPSYFAGEYKSPSRTLKLGMILGYIIASTVIFGLVFSTEYAMGIPFFNYVSLNGWGSSIILLASSGYIAWAGILTISNPILSFFLVILNISIELVTVPVTFALPSRVMLVMSFDRVLPEKFAYINPKLKSPLLASTTILILALIFNYAIAQGYLIVSAIVLIVVLFIYQLLLAAISALVAGIKGVPGISLSKKDKFELIIYGSLASIVLIMAGFFSLWYAFVNSLYSSMVIGSMATNYVIILGVPVVGVALYFIAKYYRFKHDGIDIKLAFMEIPPE